jgi:hypothetical protein
MNMDVEYAIKTDIRNNPVVREVDLQQKREFRQMLTYIALVVAMLLFWAWPHLEVVRSGYRIEELRLELDAASARNRHLRLELETQSAPQVIDERARRTLRLVAPTERDTVIVERVPPSRPAKAIVADARRNGAGQ